MRIFSINRGVKGSRTLQEHAIRFAYMITEVAKKRAKIISFWKKYGFPAVEEAYSVKRRTLFLWQKKLREGKGKLESLNCGSRSPKNKRRRRYDWRIIEEIKHLRLLYPNLGEKKIHSLLLEFCAPPQSPVSQAGYHWPYHQRQGWYAYSSSAHQRQGQDTQEEAFKSPAEAKRHQSAAPRTPCCTRYHRTLHAWSQNLHHHV